MTDLGDRLNEPGVRRDPRGRDDARTAARDQLPHGLRIGATLRQVGCMHDLHPDAPLQREVHQLIRDVVVTRRQDDVARREIECRHCLSERDRRILDHRDVAGGRADEPGDVGVRHEDRGLRLVGRLVAADPDLEVEVG
jgi:hypothetical protein